LNTFVAKHHARCKFCGSGPDFFYEGISKSWYEKDSDLRGMNKFQYEMEWQKFNRIAPCLVNVKVLRQNSKRGTCSLPVVHFKSFSKGYYTTMFIGCECKRTIWSTNTHETHNPTISNRKLTYDYKGSFKKKYIYGYVNI